MASCPNQIAAMTAGMGNGAGNSLAGGMAGDGDRFHVEAFYKLLGDETIKNMKGIGLEISH